MTYFSNSMHRRAAILVSTFLAAGCSGSGSSSESEDVGSSLEFHMTNLNDGYEEYSFGVHADGDSFSIDYRTGVSDEDFHDSDEANGPLSHAEQDMLHALETEALFDIYEADDGGEPCYSEPLRYIYKMGTVTRSSSACLVRSDDLAPETLHMLNTLEQFVWSKIEREAGFGGAGGAVND